MDAGKQWSVVAVVVCLLSTVRGELLRCHCTQARCVTTGYMCKSATRCFSDPERGVHGCLPDDQEVDMCPPGLRCCQEDMCNYVHYDYHLRTETAAGGSPDECVECSDRLQLIVSAMRKEVWFKAAVIAVPIAGACVLALLAVAAARLLRSDRRTLRRPHLKDAQLLVPWSTAEKNTTIV